MRATLVDIPEALINETLKMAHDKTKKKLIKPALENLIQRNKIRELKKFRGKLDLDIDLNALRKR